MAGKYLLVLAALAGCIDPERPEVVELTARATEPVTLGADLPIIGDPTEYRWVVTQAPATSVAAPSVQASATQLTPDVRGHYVVERWVRGHLGEQLTHYYVIAAGAVPPTADAVAPSEVAVGDTVTLDARTSLSPERLPLTYVWQLESRPRGSTATLADPGAAMTSFVADARGRYTLELEVFDGELWGTEPALLQIEAQ